MSPSRWLLLAGIAGTIILALVVVIVLLGYEERRATWFQTGRILPRTSPADEEVCPGAPKGTHCPESWTRDGFEGDATFPRRVQPPRVIHRVAPEFPESARKQSIAGRVVLDVGIRRDGTVGGVCVRAGLPCGLDAAAERAVRQWRFAPPLVDGRPADVVSTIVVDLRAGD